MLKLFSTFAICAMAFLSLQAQDQNNLKPDQMQQGTAYFIDEFGNLKEVSGPLMSISMTEFDFGNVPEGPKVNHTFKVTNVGNAPLKFTNVQASCGCTTPTWSHDDILPGATTDIFVEYNTQGRPGPFVKSITIQSNDANEPSKVIFIKGKVETQPTQQPAQQPDTH